MRVPDKFIHKLTCIACIVVFAGCDVINPADPVPAYVRIDDITVDPVPGTGTSQQKFGEVWLYVNGNYQGTYSVPALIPLIEEGDTELMFFPGIRINGIQSAADFYPFFEPYTVNATLTPEMTFVGDMHTRYRPNVAIAYLEDFESSHRITDDLDDDPETAVERITTGVFEGIGSGLITLDDSADFIQVASIPLLTDVPTNGSPVYLEMHYKNNVPFSVGLVAHGTGIEPARAAVLVLLPQEEWNKTYVDLTPALRASQLEAYQLLFTAAHDTALVKSEIFLDNLKLVHIDQ